jgi:23S rRNA (uracil1939-C5)-methyltransferase
VEYKISVYEEETHTGLVRHILTRVGFTTGEIMVCLVINGTKLPHQEEFIEFLTRIPHMTSISLNLNQEKTNVILGNKVITLWGQPYITDYIGKIKYQISPLSFYQVNPVQTKKLYEIALEYADLHGNEVVWDLYCGIGTISLFLAGKAKQVYGVEIIPEAIEDAKRNAEINFIQNAEFFVGAAEDILPEKYKEENIYADVIVVDPPRKGCDESLLDTIVQMAPKKVVYVSCDPATLARDLKYLCGRGYEMKRVQAVDQFGHSVHVETVALLCSKTNCLH